MNILAILLIVLGLIGAIGAAYGYTQNKNDDKKKKVYTGLGIVSVLLVIGGIMVMVMSGGSESKSDAALPGTTNSLGELSNSNLTAAKRLHNDTGDKIQRELNRRHDELLKRQANLN